MIRILRPLPKYVFIIILMGSSIIEAVAANNTGDPLTTYTPTLHRAINLNGASLSIDGNTWQTSIGASNFSYVGNTFANQSVNLTPTTDANRATMLRSSIWGGNVNLNISSVPSGYYDIYLYVWEDNSSEVYTISIEGSVAQANYNSGSAGSWSRLGPFRRHVTDGAINVTTTGGAANLSGIEIWTTNSPPVVVNGITDQTAIVGESFSLSIPSTTFTDPDVASILQYTAALQGGGPLPTWLSFNTSTRNFSGTPHSTDLGTVNIQVTATDEEGASISDVFQLTVTSGFYRAININGQATSIDGFNWEASSGAANFSVSQTNGGSFANQSITLNPPTDGNRASMIRSSVYGSTVNVNVTSVPNGIYDVFIYVWEDDVPQTYSISIEGTLAQASHNSGSPGTWTKLGPFRRSITDGNITISTLGGHANISGVEIWRGSSGEILVNQVNVTPSQAILAVGQSIKLEKAIVPANASNLAVDWTSNNLPVATVDNNGLVRAISEGSAEITATSVEGGRTANSNITIQSVGSNVLQNPEFDDGMNHWIVGDWTGSPNNVLQVVQSAGLSGANALHVDVKNSNNGGWTFQAKTPLSFRVEIGRTYRVSFMAKGESARQMSVALHGEGSNSDYWTASQTLTTTPQRFSYLYTPSSGQTGLNSESSFSVVFHFAKGVISDVWLDNVRVEDITGINPVTDLTLSPSSLSLQVSQSAQLTKNFTPSNASNQNVKWSSSDPSIVSVDSNGQLIALKAGSAEITAYTLNGGYSAKSTITVTGIAVAGVSVSPKALSFDTGQHFQLVATVTPANATDQTVSWTSSDTLVAKVDSSGLVTAIASGSAIIKVITNSGNFTDSTAVTVLTRVTGVTIDPEITSLVQGQTKQLKAIIAPSNASNQNVLWSSSHPNIVSVNNSGMVTALGIGSATITVKTEDWGLTNIATVNVASDQLASGYLPAWNNISGAVDQVTILNKTTSVGWNNSGGHSENQLAANINGWIEFKVDEANTTGNFLIGFSPISDNTFSNTSIEFGLQIDGPNQRVILHESSEDGFDLVEWSIGDIFRISRNGSTISYYQNGDEIRSVEADPAKAYKVKALILEGRTSSTVTSFWIPASRGQVPDAWEFGALKHLYDSSAGPSWTNKGGWGGPNNWATNITAAQMDAWYGITVAGGDITRIELRSNNLNGKIPASIGRLTSLRWLLIDANHLTGDIPASMGNLSKLEYLYLNKNNLSGNFDWIGNMVNLIDFYFAENPNINCTIPASIGNLTKLTRFVGGGFVSDRNYVQTKLHGEIPSTIANCTQLEYLALDNAELSGNIPNLSPLVKLKGLYLFNNPELGGELKLHSGLRPTTLYVFNTSISGTIPSVNNVDLVGMDFSKSLIRGSVMNLPNSQATEWLGFDSLELTQIPNWGTSFPKLWYLGLQNNLLTSIPNFTNHPNKAKLELYIENNDLDFEDIEANFTAPGVHPFKVFTYGPQRNPLPPPATLTVQANSQLNIEAPSGGTHGVYVWEKLINGSWINVANQNQATSPNTFLITNAQTSDEGYYRYTVSNTWVPNLSFQSGPIEVLVSDAPVSSVQARYNGLITSAQWRTDEAYGTNEGEYRGMYIYDYDEKYQIRSATWATPDFVTNTFSSAGNKFQLAGMTYDPNGNILTLKRYDKDAVRTHNFKYHYFDENSVPEYNNKLKSVEGYVDEYSYNKIGQTTRVQKPNGDIVNIEYDITGKVTAVYGQKDGQNISAQYLYDDRGFRLAKSVSLPDGAWRTTWYIRDASGNILSVYEEDGVPGESEGFAQTEVPIYGSGKLGTYYPIQDGSTNYEITDHLGNVRALIRDNVSIYTATMEVNSYSDERNPRIEETSYFQNIEDTEVDDARMNATPTSPYTVPTRAAYLFWNDTQGTLMQNKSIGPAIALRVQAGDTLEIETWSRFERKNDYTHDFGLVALSTLLGNTFAASGGFEALTINSTISNLEGALTAALFPDDGGDDTRPFAYLNYIIYDENMVYQSAGWKRVVDAAGFYPEEIGVLEPVRIAFDDPIAINQSGYVYVWVSNQSKETRVWFDDLRVEHTQSIVVQATDYGVWGDVLREQKTDETIYRFGYQGQFAEKDEETGWNHFDLREYDPIIGRWTSVDPKGQYYSPYVGMGNNPINGTDPDGGYFFGIFGSTSKQRHAAREFAAYTGGDVLNITSRKNIAVTYETGSAFGSDGLQVSFRDLQDFDFYGFDDVLTRVHDEEMGVRRLLAGPSPGTVEFDPATQLTLGFAGIATGTRLVTAVGGLRVPVYRVFGGGISQASGEYWSLINPRLYGSSYRNFAGLPDWNTAAFQVRGTVAIKDIFRFGKVGPAQPFHGNFGRLVPELKINSSHVELTHYNGFRIN